MKKILSILAFACIAAMTMGAYVTPDPGGRDGWQIDTATGNIIVMRAGTVVMTISSSGDLTIVDDLTVTDDLAVTGLATVGETLVVTGLTTATGGIKSTLPLLMVQSAYFCGNGANATTAVYMPSVGHWLADDLTTFTYGAAGCDGLDDTTETSGDGLLQGSGALAVKVMGMACGISAAGTDDVYTFQLRDDTADVTGVTCDVTLDGAIQACSVILDAPVTLAAGSLIAVKNVAATDDNVSAADVECQVFFTY